MKLVRRKVSRARIYVNVILVITVLVTSAFLLYSILAYLLFGVLSAICITSIDTDKMWCIERGPDASKKSFSTGPKE